MPTLPKRFPFSLISSIDLFFCLGLFPLESVFLQLLSSCRQGELFCLLRLVLEWLFLSDLVDKVFASGFFTYLQRSNICLNSGFRRCSFMNQKSLKISFSLEGGIKCQFMRAAVNYCSSSPSQFSSKLNQSQVGMQGGVSLLERTAQEFILPSQGWNKISFRPFIDPILILGFLWSRPVSRLLIYAVSWIWSGNVSSQFTMASFISSSSLEQKGGRPVTNSQSKAPKVQKSTPQECPDFWIIYGGMYYVLPQKLQVTSRLSRPALESPKSAILT